MRPLQIATLSLSLLARVTGCTPVDEEIDTAAECVSGTYWDRANEGSSQMNPGESCIGCHTQNGEGPAYQAAGTVMGAYDEPNDCNGAEGVVVRLTDDNGDIHETTTNEAGNFYFKDAIALPYTAEIESSSGVRVMSASQTNGDCAACHTANGLNNAPGRIVGP